MTKKALILIIVAASILFPFAVFSADSLKQVYLSKRYVTFDCILNGTTQKYFNFDLNDVSFVVQDEHMQYHQSWRGVTWFILKNGQKAMACAPGRNIYNDYRNWIKSNPEFMETK